MIKTITNIDVKHHDQDGEKKKAELLSHLTKTEFYGHRFNIISLCCNLKNLCAAAIYFSIITIVNYYLIYKAARLQSFAASTIHLGKYIEGCEVARLRRQKVSYSSTCLAISNFSMSKSLILSIATGSQASSMAEFLNKVLQIQIPSNFMKNSPIMKLR